MKRSILILTALLASYTINAQVPIFDPGMTITEWGLVNSPLGEEVDKIIDGSVNTKFLDFELNDGMGFTVDLGGLEMTATVIELTTANDFPVRDPIEYEVLGSNDGSAFFTIGAGTIECIPDRFHSRIYGLPNNNSYSHYRVDFSAPCDPSGGTGIPSIQMAEVQLYEEVLDVDSSQLLERAIKVFPNPNDGNFTLLNNSDIQITSIELIDINGRIVKVLNVTEGLAQNDYSVEALNSALYFLRITSEEAVVTKKVIVK